ncbi:hypothetical protein F441_23141 [Phytophthora nicotianae CJ01A1]|uniref:Uncharacterized protein n=3 Tax=Phytophthora nicotianae TaxID=4792 RepID=V9E8U4_PHYNI|nr:hypothetical protein F443_18140 [Phytophthora nicotianae P1569]ETL37733.1 hypothetical protein L916_10621 [Phytophthora nicotianae]ETO99443.1 hypothetical protein F441_23141 [Phytophthora nicotianae CJ01A1]
MPSSPRLIQTPLARFSGTTVICACCTTKVNLHRSNKCCCRQRTCCSWSSWGCPAFLTFPGMLSALSYRTSAIFWPLRITEWWKGEPSVTGCWAHMETHTVFATSTAA